MFLLATFVRGRSVRCGLEKRSAWQTSDSGVNATKRGAPRCLSLTVAVTPESSWERWAVPNAHWSAGRGRLWANSQLSDIRL